MSTLGSYPRKEFNESLELYSYSPSTQQAALVPGSSLVQYLALDGAVVLAISTTDVAVTEDLRQGASVRTAGESAIGDGGGGDYVVVPAGEGDIAMTNGMELKLLPAGALAGSDATGALVTHDGLTETVGKAVTSKVAYIGSIAEGFAGRTVLEGAQASVTGWHAGSEVGGGGFVGRASIAKSQHNGGTIISPTVPRVSAQAGATLAERRDNFLAGVGETDATGSGCFVAMGAVDETRFGAIGDGVADDSAPMQAYFSSDSKIVTRPNTYRLNSQVAKAADDVDVDFGKTRFINGGVGFLFRFGTRSDTPVHDGLKVRGGVFDQLDPATTSNFNYIQVQGTKNFGLYNFTVNNVSNGGVYIEAGCEDGEVVGNVRGKTAYTTIRGIWLAGDTASDFAPQLVDTVSITRNATPLPLYAVKRVRILANIELSAYGIYAINTRECSVEHSNIDIRGVGANRCIAINNYSPDFTVSNCTLISDRSSTGILVTQFSTGVLIEGNRFKGSFGGNRDVYVQYLAEASIQNNKFLTDSVQQITVDMGGAADIQDNYSNSPSGRVADYKFVRVNNVDEAVSGTTVGDSATSLPGVVVKNNTIKQARIPLIAQAYATANGNIPGIDSVVVKGNTLKDWNLAATSGEYAAVIFSSGTTYPIYFTAYDNDMFPAASAGRNKPLTSGAGAKEIRSDSQIGVLRVTVTSGAASTSKLYGSNFSCASSLSGNSLVLSPRTIGGAAGAAVGSVFAIVDAAGNTYSYKIHKSSTNYLVELYDSAGTQIPLSTTNATVDVVVSGDAT